MENNNPFDLRAYYGSNLIICSVVAQHRRERKKKNIRDLCHVCVFVFVFIVCAAGSLIPAEIH